jgi:DNA-binding MarR family transcriptional regulator
MKQNLKSPSVQDLNPVIHERSRLALMTYLVSVREATFSEVKAELGLTDGNLTLHMKVLEKNGYARVHKSLVRRRPRTTYQITEKGVRAFQEYVALLERILDLSRRPPPERR